MTIDLKSGGQNKILNPADKRLDDFYNRPTREEIARQETSSRQQQQRQEDIEHERRQSEQAGEIILSWDAPEFEVYEKSTRWYLIAGIFVVIMAIWGLVTDSPIMSITFILIGIVGYIQLQRDPTIRTFSITTTGLLVGKELYPYENITSFWIFYDPPHMKIISLHTTAKFLPFVHIPLGTEEPAAIHEALTPYVPEIEQHPSIVDTLEKVLHI